MTENLATLNWLKSKFPRLDVHQRAFLKKELLLIVIATPIVAISMSSLSKHYWIGHDPGEVSCMPWTWFVVEKISAQQAPTFAWRHNHIAVVKANNLEPYVKTGTPLAKLIVGLPGDSIRIEDGAVFVNASTTPVGHVEQEAISRMDVHVAKTNRLIPARAIASFNRAWTLKDGDVFLMGLTPRSQDSRYFGPQKIADLRGRVVAPLF